MSGLFASSGSREWRWTLPLENGRSVQNDEDSLSWELPVSSSATDTFLLNIKSC